jgi:hypothetical protein
MYDMQPYFPLSVVHHPNITRATTSQFCVNGMYEAADRYGWWQKYKIKRLPHQIPSDELVSRHPITVCCKFSRSCSSGFFLLVQKQRTIIGAVVNQFIVQPLSMYYLVWPAMNFFGSPGMTGELLPMFALGPKCLVAQYA